MYYSATIQSCQRLLCRLVVLARVAALYEVVSSVAGIGRGASAGCTKVRSRPLVNGDIGLHGGSSWRQLNDGLSPPFCSIASHSSSTSVPPRVLSTSGASAPSNAVGSALPRFGAMSLSSLAVDSLLAKMTKLADSTRVCSST